METAPAVLGETIAEDYRPGELLRELLAMRRADPFAKQALAGALGRQRCFLEAVRAAYRVAVRQSPGETFPVASPRVARRLEDWRSRAAESAAHPPARPAASHGTDHEPSPGQGATGTPRDVIRLNGYRLAHSMAVASEVVGMLGEEFQHAEDARAWRPVFVASSYAVVLASALRSHTDDVFAGTFLYGTCGLLQRRYAGTASPAGGDAALGLARELGRCWDLPPSLRAAFEPADARDTLPDLVHRAVCAAARHGFADPAGVLAWPGDCPEHEPILDDYFRKSGGTQGVEVGAGVMMAIALIAPD